MNKLLALAIAIAAEAFKDTLDKAGRPYIEHCITVMETCGGDDKRKIKAVLHDLMEDFPEVWTEKRLAEKGFPHDIIRDLSLLTHNKKECSYEDYIRRLAPFEDTREIKKADLRHNSNLTRIKGLTHKDMKRVERYHWAYTYLSKV